MFFELIDRWIRFVKFREYYKLERPFWAVVEAGLMLSRMNWYCSAAFWGWSVTI